MGQQRTRFYGHLPAQTPRKIGDNKPVPQRRFQRLRGADLHIQFGSTALTSCGGLGLWHAFLERFGLEGWLETYAQMDRGPEAFTAPELSRFFIDTRVLGAARLHHVDAWRQDPLVTRCHGLETLPSDETLGRYFKAFSPEDLWALLQLNQRVLERGLKRLCRRRGLQGRQSLRAILDFDSSTFPDYGHKEEADRGRSFRHKDHPGFQPKFAFLGGAGLLLHQELAPQSVNLGKDFERFEAQARAKLPRAVKLWAIRGDGALYSQERLKRWEREGLTYAVTARNTSHLLEAIARIPEEKWSEAVDADGHYCSLARISYCPKSWDQRRTFIISRRLRDLHGQALLLEELRYDYFAYVTNYRRRLEEQFKFCVERCSLENCIKEAKNGLHYGALPHHEAHANRAYLAHVQLVYNLLLFWKLLEAPPGVDRWTVDTLRARILNVPANLIRRGLRWVLSLPKRWPWQFIFKLLVDPACASP